MRYESMVIADPVKAKSELERIEGDIKALIEKVGGENIDIERYGERKLAYRVGPYTRGYYLLIHFDLDGPKVPVLRREFKLYEDLFRYLIFKDEDAGLDRRDLAKPVSFNIDALGKSKFDRREPVGAANDSAPTSAEE